LRRAAKDTKRIGRKAKRVSRLSTAEQNPNDYSFEHHMMPVSTLLQLKLPRSVFR